MQTVKKIVITGGPCAGKTNVLGYIPSAAARCGYTVLTVPETATEFISGGVAPWTCGTNFEYQQCQMRLQLKKEELFLRAARTMPKEKILIVCDRGLLDNKAYMTEAEFAAILDELGMTEQEAVGSYDAVFHLETAAKRCDEYTISNNVARIESPDQAIALDDAILDCWKAHPYRQIMISRTSFDEKMEDVAEAIYEFLSRS